MRVGFRCALLVFLVAGSFGCTSQVKKCNDAKEKAYHYWWAVAFNANASECREAAGRARDTATTAKPLEAKRAAEIAALACKDDPTISLPVSYSKKAYDACGEVEL